MLTEIGVLHGVTAYYPTGPTPHDWLNIFHHEVPTSLSPVSRVADRPVVARQVKVECDFRYSRRIDLASLSTAPRNDRLHHALGQGSCTKRKTARWLIDNVSVFQVTCEEKTFCK